jgi:hypothetical protein
VPSESDKESDQREAKAQKSERQDKWDKAYERMRRALAKLDERWRLSLAGLDPMTGKRPDVALPVFIVHPETNARQAIVENVRWLDTNVSIRSPCFIHVHTAGAGKRGVDCPVLLDQKDFQRWLACARTAFKIAPPSTGTTLRRRKGPAPGTVDRFGKSDRMLFPEIERIRRKDHKSVYAAALDLARAGKVLGSGTGESRAKRLAKRFSEAHRSTTTR